MTLTVAASSLAVLLSIAALVGYALSAGRLLERLAVLTSTVQELRGELRSMETLRAADQRHDAADLDLLRRVGALESDATSLRAIVQDQSRQLERLLTLSEGGTPAHGVPRSVQR